MNWLAHALLSEPQPQARLGNLLADLLRPQHLINAGEMFLRGVRRHRAIDSFTDLHPVVKRSRRRLASRYGHGRGILVDIFYDHFLALNWANYCPKPLGQFTAGVYQEVDAHFHQLPPEAQGILRRLIDEDWLGSYRAIEGISVAVQRVSLRLSPRVRTILKLETAIPELVEHFTGLRDDFAEFFPELQNHLCMKSLS